MKRKKVIAGVIAALVVIAVLFGYSDAAATRRTSMGHARIDITDAGARLCAGGKCMPCDGDENWAALDATTGFELAVIPEYGMVASANGVTAQCPWR